MALALALAGLLAGTSVAGAQSCILTRLDAPVLDAFRDIAGADEDWQFTLSWRYGKSDRHFRGTHEETNRRAEGSEVINTVHLADLSLTRRFDRRTSVELGVPYLMATRSHPIRDDDRVVIGRSKLNSRGLGDVTLVGRRLVWDPKAHPRSNLSLGLGIKFPTGQDNVHDTRIRYEDGELVPAVETVDQSVQPGDGGFGLILNIGGFQLFGRRGIVAAYGAATYIVAPEGTNGVYTYRSAPGEEVMSIADQYVARAGLQASRPGWHGFSYGLGGRIEGIPVHDLVGSSDGFRRPGYMLSVEPSVTWSHGVHSVVVAVPFAVERNRQRSVPDLRRGSHGDAAFPDYIVLASYARRF